MIMLQHNKLNSDLPFQASVKDVLPIVIITEAKFFRVGNDLEIKNLEDSWIIQDYFIKPVPIKTIDGLMSVDDVISKLSYHSEPILLAAESTTDLISSGLEQIGIITVAVENVSAERQDGTIRSLKVGEPVYLHETILTKAHSYVKITLNDGTVFQLGTHSRARLDKYSYDPDESDGGEFESYVSSGTFRYISGKISGHDQGQHTTIKTPSVQINIRGSDIDAQINADGSTTILHLSGFISIISQYHLREILVYERGTSVHIPNQDISYRIKTLTEDEIQVKISEKWQIIDHLDPPQNEILDLESKDISIVSPDVGAYNPFSSGNLDVNEGKLVDELRSIDETSQVEAIDETSQVEASEDVIIPLKVDDTLNTPEVTFSSPLNIFPSLSSMEVTLDEDNSKEISVEEGNLTQFSQPAHGEVVDNGDGTLTYNPNLNFNGEDSFTYTLNEIDSVFVKLIINTVNDSPVAVDDNIDTDEDVPLNLSEKLLENDFDVDEGDSISIVSVSDLTHGTVSLNDSGDFVYQPEQDFYGLAEFVYTIEDSQGEQSTGSVKVNVSPVNDAPVAVDDAFATETSLIISADSLSKNDRDVDNDNDALKVIEVLNPSNGDVSLSEGEIVFSFKDNTVTTGGFEYTVSDGEKTDVGQVSINRYAGEDDEPITSSVEHPIVHPPVAVDDSIVLEKGTILVNDSRVDDDSVVLENGTTLVISADSLSKNDRDVDNDALKVDKVFNPSNGDVSLSEGEIVFSFKDNTVTTGGFEYTVSDGEKTDIGQVSITREINTPPVAVDDSIVLEKGTIFVNDLPVNDDSVVLENETTLVISADSLLKNDYDLNLGDTYTISKVNSNHGDVELKEDGNVLFTPEPDFTVNASFEYVIKDNHGAESAPAKVEIEIKNIAVDDSVNHPKNTTGSIRGTFLLENDNKEGEPLTITAVDNVINGDALLLDNGDIQFTPATNFEGDAQFDYTVIDALGRTDKATVTVNVFNMPPVAEEDAFTTQPNIELFISKADLLSNDWDINSDALTLTKVDNPENGSISYRDESIVFTPTADFSGEASFEYTIKDTSEATDTAKVSITVTPPINIPPIINFDQTPLEYNTAIGEAQPIYSNVTIDDPDSPNFDGGTVKVLINNRTPNDVLEIQNIDQITVSNKTNGEIYYNEKPIGNFVTNFVTGGLLIGLNADANPDTTAALLQAITYKNTSAIPSTTTRAEPSTEIRVEITLNDGDGGESLPKSRDIKIIPPPLKAVDDVIENEISLPFPFAFDRYDIHLSADGLLANDIPTNPYDILTVSPIFTNLSEGVVEAELVNNNHEVQLFIDGLINDDLSKPITFDYTVEDDHGGKDTATVTVNPSNVISGTPGEDTLEGNDSLEIIVGKEGNDTFAPSEGYDILLGGEGDDLFLFDPNSAAGVRIDGGNGIDTLSFNGIDTLSFNGKGQTLDLIQNSAQASDQQLSLQNMEIIDLQGNNNQLRLSVEDVLELFDGNLKIEGDASNFVNSVAQGWKIDPTESSLPSEYSDPSYIHYIANGANLLVSADIAYQLIS
jgi:hypothetical protein